MNGVHEYDYTIVNAGTPEEYDSVTLNGYEFARITRKDGWYYPTATLGSKAGQVILKRGSHIGAFEECMFYADLERLPEKFDLEVTE